MMKSLGETNQLNTANQDTPYGKNKQKVEVERYL